MPTRPPISTPVEEILDILDARATAAAPAVARTLIAALTTCPTVLAPAYNPAELGTALSALAASSVHGAVADKPLLEAFAEPRPPDSEPRSYHALRAMILLVAAAAHRGLITPLAPAHLNALVPLLAHRTRVAGYGEYAFYEALPVPSDLSQLLEAWNRAMHSDDAERSATSRIRAVLALISEVRLAVHKLPTPRRALPTPVSPTKELIATLVTRLARPPEPDADPESPVLVPADDGEESQGVETPESDSMLLATAVTGERESDLDEATDTAEARRDHSVWVARLFAAGSDATLTSGEAMLAYKALRAALTEAEAGCDVARVETCCTGILLLVTSRSIYYLSELIDLDELPENAVASDSRQTGISVRRGIHVFQVPSAERFWRPDAPSRLLPPVSDRIQIGLPNDVRACLETLRAVGADTRPPGYRLFRSSRRQLERGLSDLTRQLRRDPRLSRLSPGRLRQVLPVQAFAHCHDSARAMLVAGQDLGLSTGPLHYDCVDNDDLQLLYDVALSDIVPGRPIRRAAGQRYSLPNWVGSQLQLPDATVREFVDRLVSAVGRRSRGDLDEQLRRFPAYVRYTAWMLMAGTAHRGGKALARLTAADLELNAGLAVIADEVRDAGHRGRLVALAPLLRTQLGDYLALCRSLSDQLTAAKPQDLGVWCDCDTRALGRLAKRLAATADGSGPLLVLFDANLGEAPIDNAWLLAALPPGWDFTSPVNLFRHRAATVLRRLGADPEILAAHLGHLTFGTQPFGRTGVASPLAFVDTLAPVVETLLRQDGWRVARLAPGVQPIAPALAPVSLEAERRFAAALREAHRHGRDLLRNRLARRKAAQPSIDEDVSKALASVVSGYDRHAPARRVELSQSQLERIVHTLVEDVADDTDHLEWRTNALRHRLQGLRKRCGWKTPLPARVFRPRIEPSRFLPGMPAVYTELVQLRDWATRDFPDRSQLHRRLTELGDTEASPDEAGHAYLHAAVLLVLAGGFLDEDRLAGTLANLQGARRSHSLPDLLIVPRTVRRRDGQAVKISECLFGVCAIAASRCPKAAPPSLADLNRWLYAALPSKARPVRRTEALRALLSLTRIGRRFEVPGALYAVETGVVPSRELPAPVLCAYLDGSPSPASATVDGPTAVPPPPARPKTPAGPRYDSPAATEQAYLDLAGCLYAEKGQEKRIRWLPGQALRPDRFRDRLRAYVLEGIAAWLATRGASRAEIAVALFHWARELLGPHGRVDREGCLEVRSVHTLVTRIGRALVRLVGNAQLSDLAPEEWEELYGSLLHAQPTLSRPKVAAALLRFHRYLVSAWEIDEIDEAPLLGLAGGRADLPEAGFVSPQDHQAIKNILTAWHEQTLSTPPDSGWDPRLVSAALLIWILTYRTGMRIGEAHLLRLGSFADGPSGLTLKVAPSRYGRLKSRATRRLISLADRLSPDEDTLLRQWITDRGSMSADEDPVHGLLFCERADVRRPLSRPALVALITAALRAATGRPEARPYWARHAHLTARVAACGLDSSDVVQLQERGVLRAAAGEDAPTHRSHRLLHAISVEGGHAHPDTTLTNYSHAIGLWSAGVPVMSWEALSTQEQARLAGVSHGWYRKMCHEAGAPKGNPRAQLTAVMVRADIETCPAATVGPVPELPPMQGSAPWRVVDVANLIFDLQDGVPANVLARQYSLRKGQWKTILDRIVDLQKRSRYVLVSTQRLLAAYGQLGDSPPHDLVDLRFAPDEVEHRNARARELLKRADSLARTDRAIAGRLVEAFSVGHRVGRQYVRFSDVGHAKDYITGLSDLAGPGFQLRVIASVGSATTNPGATRDRHASLLGVSPHYLEIQHRPSARGIGNAHDYRVYLCTAGDRAVARPLWTALLACGVWLATTE